MTPPPLTTRGVCCGAWAALLGLMTVAASLFANRLDPSLGGLYNDFADYWAAARILDHGGNPYDVGLLTRVLHEAGLHTLVGTGYSYPLLLAELLRPLGLLPPMVAGALFTAISLAGLGLGVALLLSALPGLPRWEAFLLATAAAAFPPTTGTLYMGQANLLLLPPLALALRERARPAGLALAAAVKLFPIVPALAHLAEGRRGVRPLLLTGTAALALTVGPNLLAGGGAYGGSLLAMFGPDPYWTNQSINGWLSRVLPGGVPETPLMVAVAAGLGALAVAVASRQRLSWRGAYAVLLWYAVIAAPKNSIWNFLPLLVVMAFLWPLVRGHRTGVALFGLSWLLISMPGPGPWLDSVPLAGALLLGGVLAWALLRRPAEREDDVTWKIWTWSSEAARSSAPAAPSERTSGSRARRSSGSDRA